LIPILYQDEHMVFVNKPSGLLVHRSTISEDKIFLVQQLRDQLCQRVYTVHRLDRATSGVMVFGFSSEAAQRLSAQFEQRLVAKRYHAMVRGFVPDQGVIDYPLGEAPSKPLQDAVTQYRRLATVELPYAVGRYATARYSWVEVSPLTGRMHQIRKHFSHMRHPIIGDVNYGDNKHNRFAREQLGLSRLMLFAQQLVLTHPYTGERLAATAPMDLSICERFQSWGWGV
jgi:tRNA pseudouridine65 synthase